MRLVNELESCLIAVLSLIISSVVFGKEVGITVDRGHANCPEGWISNNEKTRCFKLVTFDRPRTFSHGFKVCNELGGTEVETRRRNGSKETSEYPVTLASVYKLSDEDAIRRTLLEQGDGQKTANGCFVGLRKYALFRYPPGWYWIDSGNPISIRDSEITWTSSYNASWLLRFKFPFEKCGFFDVGGLGRRPCWLIDSELSCAVCGTVAYDSGGLNPNKYTELIRQTDEIISREPKLDLPGYSSLNCTDAWENSLSVGLCQNVSNILDSAWSSYQDSLNLPSINFSWKEEPLLNGDLTTTSGPYLDASKQRQKKTFYWDQDPGSVPALSDEMKLIGLSAQPTYYPLKRSSYEGHEFAASQTEGSVEGGLKEEEEVVYKQSSDSIEGVLVPVTKSISADSSVALKEPIEAQVYPSDASLSFTAGVVSSSTSTSTTTTTTTTTTSTSTSTTTTTTSTTTTTTTSTSTSTSANTTTTTTTTTATTNSTTTSTTTLKSAFYSTSKFLYTPKSENVRTNAFVKRNSNMPAGSSNTGRMHDEVMIASFEKEPEHSLLGFGAGEYISSENEDSEEAQEVDYVDGRGKVKVEKSIQGHVDVIERTLNKKLIAGLAVGILLILLSLVLFCVFFLRRRSEDSGSAQGLGDPNKEAARNKLNGLQLASMRPILGRKGSKIVQMSQKSISYDSSMALPEKKSIVSIEDTNFSPEYFNSGECEEGAKITPYYVAQSQANTLQLHSGRNVNFGYDTRAQTHKQISLKSPKYHDFFYSEPSK